MFPYTLLIICLCFLVLACALVRWDRRSGASTADAVAFFKARGNLEYDLDVLKRPKGPPNREVREITNLEMEARHERWREMYGADNRAWMKEIDKACSSYLKWDRGYITKTTTTTTVEK